jgi:hypothetical protein
VQATTLDGTILELMQQTALSEAGELYVDASGVVVFRNRHAVLTDTRSNTSQCTFTSAAVPGVGELQYIGSPGMSDDRGQMYNTVRATVTGGAEQTATDATSVARNRERSLPSESLILQTDANALSWAKFVLRQTKDPQFRFTSLTLDTRLDKDALFPQALGRDMGDRITVVRRPPGVVDSREVLIRSIEHTWNSPDEWITTWGLQPASTYQYWTIGHPTLGRIGRNAIAF